MDSTKRQRRFSSLEEQETEHKKRKVAPGLELKGGLGASANTGSTNHAESNLEDLTSSGSSRAASFDPFDSPVTSSASEPPSSGSDEEDSAETMSVAERLLLHAKATAQASQAPGAFSNATAASTSGFRDAGTGDLTSLLRQSGAVGRSAAGGGAAPAGSAGTSAAEQMKAALKRMREELTRPVDAFSTTSTALALTTVNAADESAEVLAGLVRAKVPRAPPEERKALRKLKYIDHSLMTYMPIRKDFYIVPPDVQALNEAEVKQLWRDLDGAKVKGKHAPRPLRSWHGTGLPDKVLAVLDARGYTNPFAVQSLGAPALMSGRDLLITAKTGSGKTLSYVLPLIRHCVDQPRCGPGQGPTGLILVPTQELATQVYGLVEELCAAAGLRPVASYGSTSLRENVQLAKAGCDVMVATPGRLLDLLTTNGGNSITLSRTSFVVVDEADRLFDSGFMEHVVAFLKNVRPDRQVAMISATMPRELRKLVLSQMQSDPIEISVGGKPTPASNVEQSFYVFDEEVYDVDTVKRNRSPRFLKLLEIVGEEAKEGEEKRLMLIFVQRKEEVDELFGSMSVLGYNARIATLYGGMDPIDREFALEHFAPGKQFILIATGVAERGLDIPFLDLVINYSMPDHYEAYVHRIGRTGRAGRPGRAVSFLTRGKDDDVMPELVEGLERCGQSNIPEEMYEVAQKVRELRKEGHARYNTSFMRGYMKGRSQRFADRDQKALAREAAKAAGLEGFASSSSSEEDSDADSSASEVEIVEVRGGTSSSLANGSLNEARAVGPGALTVHGGAGKQVALAGAGAGTVSAEDRIAKALAFAHKTTAAVADAANGEAGGDGCDVRFQCEYPINDLPDVIRGKLQSRSFLDTVAESTNTSIVKKGVYFDPKLKHSYRLKEGERTLYLLVVAKTPEAVREARAKLDEMKNEVLSRQKKKASAFGATL